jgi:HlyD family secretion protein
MATTQPAPDTTSNTNLTSSAMTGPDRFGQAQESGFSGRRLRRWAGAIVAIVVVAGGLFAGLSAFSADAKNADEDYLYHTVTRGDLPITITERGTLESQDNIEIKCEVDDVAGDGVSGTPILWIVDNGASVKKGDLLVELDAAQHLERLDKQILDAERALAQKTQADIQYESQEDKNRTREMKAELDVKLAELALEQYEDENGGTFQIELQAIDLAIQQTMARRKIQEKNFEAVKKLATLGYKSAGDLAAAQLEALEAKNDHEQQESRRKELVNYSYVKKKLQLEGEVESAKRALIQIRRDNEARIAQARVARDTADRAYEKEQERLADYREQLEKCKIYAPQDGLVAYAVEASRWGQQSQIEPGAAVRDRQHILSIPDLSRMQVKMSVHESVVDLTQAGLPADVRVDAFSDQSYEGTVKSVAVLPDPGGWLSSGAKVYTTIVGIDGTVEKLKPGMTAVVEINVEVLHDVLSVPIQALIQRSKETWCYVSSGGSIEKRIVKLGKTNEKFVEILDGLKEGESVILNPAAVLETTVGTEEEDNGISPEKSRSLDVTT